MNLASGLAFGHGGVFVLQSPYLLFYPDRDRDDVPDGDPEVLLTGFGMEDAHSVANSLTWGPDGWLYGCQGSTVTANIRGIEFQQGVWRYHPPTRRFELFCEGGGNLWGLDFDRHGNLFTARTTAASSCSTACRGATTGSSSASTARCTTRTPTATSTTSRTRGSTAGTSPSAASSTRRTPSPPSAAAGTSPPTCSAMRSTGTRSSRADRRSAAATAATCLRANDTWFAPSDVTLGPDGAVYVADWHDKRTAHPDPDADWDRSNGRIYRIAPPKAEPAKVPDLAALSNDELVALRSHPNIWYRRRARRLLGERQAKDGLDLLRDEASTGRGSVALEALWILHGCQAIEPGLAERLLDHPDAEIRAWMVRLLGDEPQVAPSLTERLVALAAKEPSVLVRASWPARPSGCRHRPGSTSRSGSSSATWIGTTLTSRSCSGGPSSATRPPRSTRWCNGSRPPKPGAPT